jgi:hypothetical protein
MKGKTFVLGLLVGCIGGWAAAQQKPQLREEGSAGGAGNIVSFEAYRAKAGGERRSSEDAHDAEAFAPPSDGTMRSARADVDERVRKTVKKRRRRTA